MRKIALLVLFALILAVSVAAQEMRTVIADPLMMRAGDPAPFRFVGAAVEIVVHPPLSEDGRPSVIATFSLSGIERAVICPYPDAIVACANLSLGQRYEVAGHLANEGAAIPPGSYVARHLRSVAPSAE